MVSDKLLYEDVKKLSTIRQQWPQDHWYSRSTEEDLLLKLIVRIWWGRY